MKFHAESIGNTCLKNLKKWSYDVFLIGSRYDMLLQKRGFKNGKMRFQHSLSCEVRDLGTPRARNSTPNDSIDDRFQ